MDGKKNGLPGFVLNFEKQLLCQCSSISEGVTRNTHKEPRPRPAADRQLMHPDLLG